MCVVGWWNAKSWNWYRVLFLQGVFVFVFFFVFFQKGELLRTCRWFHGREVETWFIYIKGACSFYLLISASLDFFLLFFSRWVSKHIQSNTQSLPSFGVALDIDASVSVRIEQITPYVPVYPFTLTKSQNT